MGAFVTGRAARDALLLSAGGAAQLPWLILASALAVSVMGLCYSPVSARLRRDRLAVFGAILGAAVYGAAFLFGHLVGGAFHAVLYVVVEVLGALAILQFWTLVNELFDARSARRLFGLIGAGGTAANILIGLAVAWVANRFGADALLLQCALLSGMMALMGYAAGRSGRQRMFARAATGRLWSGPTRGGVRQALAHPHLRTIAGLAAITFFTTTLVDYEFKVIAGQHLDRDALAAFFGHVSTAVGLVGILLQLFATGRLLRIAGVVGALAVLPTTIGLGSLALAIFPSLWGATAAKGADSLFRYSINDASTQLLYLPVPAQDRAASKTLIDAVVKPLAIALAGLGLAAWQALSLGPSPLAWIGVVLCGVWLTIVLGLRSSYVKVLQETLTRPRADLEALGTSLQDATGREALARALESEEPDEVLNALELLPMIPDMEVDGRVQTLIAHPVASVRIAAIRHFARRQQVGVISALEQAFDDPVGEVRMAAVTTYCALGRTRAVDRVKGLLDDPDPGVRGAAITGLIRDGGLDGVLMAAEALKALITHPEPDMRARAATVLGAIGIRNFHQPVLELMSDPAPEVRRRAIQAAGQLRSPEFILPLIYRSGSGDAGSEASLALAAYGTEVLPTLAKVLDHPLEDLSVRRAIAKVLARIPDREAVRLAVRHLEDPDEELRARLCRSLARLVRTQRIQHGDRTRVRTAIGAELERAWSALSAAEQLGLSENPSRDPHGARDAQHLFASALLEKVHRIEQRIFLLLSALYPEAGMEQVIEGLHRSNDADPRRRANAVELLDNLLDRPLKRRLLPLLDEAPRATKLRAVEAMPSLSKDAVARTLASLCRDESAWVRACALWFLSLRPALPDFPEVLEEAGDDESPVVRETALAAAFRLDPALAQTLAGGLQEDPTEQVARYARQLLGGRDVTRAWPLTAG
ncbi:MAG TPA: Npt1/Npt2 family nucleotide transporter [Myxococcaceae bacterium]|nr:Npt1/Npt2 family nucleotide transporter [Myxococcaceae bacterium]